MRLPQQLTDSVHFALHSDEELIDALGTNCSSDEASEIRRLTAIGLPPITSPDALAVMIGYHPRFVWSLINRPGRHYRRFSIPKGKGVREINAPKVGLKIIQKWLSIHFQRAWIPVEHVHGFVPGRSHISAANRHLGAEWVFSIDIQNFFPSVSRHKVSEAIYSLGYRGSDSIDCIVGVCSIPTGLVQGAPTSPVLSNIALHPLDSQLAHIAASTGTTFTRYADDIVFSGSGDIPEDLTARIETIFVESGWTLAAHKRSVAVLPARLKVHGLLVHGDSVRLTKGYRNRIRAYRHLANAGKIDLQQQPDVGGHLNYASQVERFANVNG